MSDKNSNKFISKSQLFEIYEYYSSDIDDLPDFQMEKWEIIRSAFSGKREANNICCIIRDLDGNYSDHWLDMQNNIIEELEELEYKVVVVEDSISRCLRVSW